MGFYEGTCEDCSSYSSERDCYYCPETGEEKFLCPSCADQLNEEETPDGS